MRRARFLPAAEAELLHEVDYYSSARQGFGIRFNAAVRATVDRAARSPEAGAPAPEGTRKLRVKGFPFNVVYRHSPEDILVVAIAPDARQPAYWRQRLR